jgi:2-aminoadipate transaminase
MPKAEGISWTRPEGGLFLWVTLPDEIDTEEMFAEAVENDVAYVLGKAFCANAGGEHSMRLNFSYPDDAEITEGVRRLAKAVKSRLK